MARDGDDILLAAFGCGAGLWMFRKGFSALKLKRTVAGMATSKVRSMAMGTVELAGRAELLSPLEDPIYRSPCAYFQVVVEEQRGHGKKRRWVTIHRSDSAAHPFLLADDTGRVAVLPAHAELYCRKDVERTCSWGMSLFSGGGDPRVDAFVRSVPGRTSGPARVTAYILREGDPLYVLGYAAPLDRPLKPLERVQRRVERSLQDLARMLKSDPRRMRALDVNGDGRVDVDEWDAGLARLKNELERRRLKEDLLGPQPAALVRRSPEGLLVISDGSERELLSRLSGDAFLNIFGGPALTVGCAAYLAHRLNLL